MGRPTIGITSPLESIDEEDLAQYEVARHKKLLESTGANAVILTRGKATASALDQTQLDGLLFSGGGDVAPDLYGGRSELADNRVDPIRDAGEMALLWRAFAERKPTLCVCRGMQLANIAFGGTLIEDLPSELGPRYRIKHHQVRELNEPATVGTHRVVVKPKSLLREITGQSSIWTNSLHHQAIRSLAPPLASVGTTSDDVIEAIELKVRDFYFLGVQWHPESLPDASASESIYSSLVQAARESS
ncbi:MAG TPA: gamma-glutamyl-gamma-aminobutyrate hydrolase family protein [Candidatus Baltobacteraceae bacterium]|jgi:putative glutamine amidotransferase|nr:gamma-glutamyl-gamma-aminobutyrate hydrolase family protein [Candidatus Baltobacteraceae bacterium]